MARLYAKTPSRQDAKQGGQALWGSGYDHDIDRQTHSISCLWFRVISLIIPGFLGALATCRLGVKKIAPISLALLMLTGCSSSLWTSQSALAVVSQDDTSLRLQGDFDSAYYVFDSTESITIVLIEGPDEDPTQAAAIRMMWQPKAGLTPVNPDATNATIQYIVFANRRTDEGFYQEVGIYSGAGFMHLDSEPGETRLTASLWQADLLLADRSDRFKDLLGQSTLKGSFTAERDSAKVQQLLKNLNFKVSQRLGYPRLVGKNENPQGPIAKHTTP